MVAARFRVRVHRRPRQSGGSPTAVTPSRVRLRPLTPRIAQTIRTEQIRLSRRGESLPLGVSAGAAAGADAEVVRGPTDNEKSPIGVRAVERRVIVENLSHVRERVGQHVMLSFVGGGRPRRLSFVTALRMIAAVRRISASLPPVCRPSVELLICSRWPRLGRHSRDARDARC